MVFGQDFEKFCEVCFIVWEIFLVKRSSSESTKRELNLSETVWGSVTDSISLRSWVLWLLCGEFPVSLFITCHITLVLLLEDIMNLIIFFLFCFLWKSV